MLFYEQFYRVHGIRKLDQLMRPPLSSSESLTLPKRSILHYVTDDPLQAGPASDELIFKQITRPIQMGHVTEIGDTKGNPRRISVAIDPLVRKYHTQNRRFRQMRDLVQATRDESTLVVYNYGFIAPLYRYMRSYYSEYYKWTNSSAALWKNVAKVAEESDRHQFVLCKIPLILPSVPDLNIGTQGVTQRMVSIFSSGESLLLLELWKWFGEGRADSQLSLIPLDRLARVNLVYQESGQWFVVNLGLLNSWRSAPSDERQADPKANTEGLPPATMQRRWLRLMMSLSHVRTETNLDADAPATAKEPQVLPNARPEESEVQTSDFEPDEASSSQAPQETALADTDVTDTAPDLTDEEEIARQVDADLSQLETISRAAVPELDAPEEVTIVEAATLEDGVMNVCERLADKGMLSAAEYLRFSTLASAYRKIKAPDGKGTLEQFIQIPPETLKISESPQLTDIKSVTDKTMLRSSLLAFDSRYIEKVLAKDVAGMVLNIQHAGIAVTGYEVERVDDILGSYDNHVVKITPVEGTSSTLQFKLPALSEDGTLRSNEVSYRLRKQVSDLPIRKIGPGRVALTSYYGKVFVTRSTKRVNDWGQWLRNQIMAKGLDDADETITSMYPAPVFDRGFQSPKVYSAIAMGFRAFVLKTARYDRTNGQKTFSVSFDHSKREALYGAATLALYEKAGALVCGVSSQGEYLVVDANDTFYAGRNGTLVDLGPIEHLLGVGQEKAPVDFAEMRVMGRTIPIGLVLGYEMGLDKLLRLLKVTPRRVPAGQRANLGSDEYALVFSDETLVFSRDDRAASLVLAGFNDYHRGIRAFSVQEFNRKGVYLNVLDAGGPSARYLRELDLLYQLFIDPITRDLLIEMREPTNFRGLILRSCEMLLNDQHPAELDPEFMRIKGYERMAGAVYAEIVRSIRSHAGRTGKARMPIDLNPYAVWKAITQDPSMAMVSDINPIENLKQQEAVTFAGTGGRGSRSMTKHTREFHRNNMGTISESTVDSSDVAINTFTSADPQFTSLRGISRRYKIGETGATALLSTSALLAPGSDRDDPKRV